MVNFMKNYDNYNFSSGFLSIKVLFSCSNVGSFQEGFDVTSAFGLNFAWLICKEK